MALTSKTQSLLQEIQREVKSSITGSQEFKTRDEVIDLAVEQLYDQLKAEVNMTITTEQEKIYTDMLDMLTWKLEKENYALEHQEDLLDEEEGYQGRGCAGAGGRRPTTP